MKAVAEEMSPPVAATLSPFQVLTAPPKRSMAIISVTSWVAVVVCVMEPDVKLELLAETERGAVISNNGSRSLCMAVIIDRHHYST